MSTFSENAEQNWPEDEASIEASHYNCTVLQNFDSRLPELVAKLKKDLTHWEKVFEDASLTLRFIAEFNRKVPDFCRMETSWMETVQNDLFI